MPTVPRRQGQIGTAPLPGVRVSPQAPEAAFGVPGDGVDIASPLAGVIGPMVQKARRDADQVALLDSDNQIAQLSTDLETRALSRQGKNALDNGDVFTDFDKGAGEIESSLASDAQKLAFRRSVLARRQSLYASVERHASTQHEAFDRDTTASALDLRTDNALKNYDDPGIRQQSMDEARAILKDFGARQGWAPETTDQKVATHLSAMHASVMRQFADAKQLPEAIQYYEDHKEDFVGEDAARASALASAARVQNDGDTAARAILSGGSAGLIERGNIDLTKRSRVKNADGSVSTVRSISIEEDGKTILIPTVVDGKVVSDDAAVAHYKKTGEHLGTFKDEQSANDYAQRLHGAQADMIAGRGAGTVPVTPTDAFTQAEAITDPAVRKIATDAVVQHFSRLNQLQGIERDNARANVMRDLEASGGHLNTASSDWQTINGFPEGEQVLARQHQLLHPPKDPGDPDKYNSVIAGLYTSPATRDQVLSMPVSDIIADKNMNQGQKTDLIQRIHAEQNRDAAATLADLKRQHADATSEMKQLQRDLKQAEKDGDDDARENAQAQLYAAQQREQTLKGQLITAQHRSRTVTPQSGAAAPSTDAPAATKTTPSNPYGLSAAKPVTQSMLDDIVKHGEGYATYLRSMGYAVPKVLPTAPAATPTPTAVTPAPTPTPAPVQPKPAASKPAAQPAVTLEPMRPTGTAPNAPTSGLSVPSVGTPYEKNGHTVIDTPRPDVAGHVPTHRLDQPTNRQPNETWTQYENRVLGEKSKPADAAIKSELTALEPDVRDAAVTMVADAKKAGIHLETKETLRTQGRQEHLFRQGRAPGSQGSPVTWTLTSDHTTGRAIDFDGDPKALAWLEKNAARYGFTTLGDLDPGHVSMPKTTRSAQ